MSDIVTIIISIIIVGVMAVLFVKYGVDWSRDRGKGFGAREMKDNGLDPEEEHPDDWPF